MFIPTFAFIAVSAIFSSTNAQSIDPDSVDIATRDSWCISQQAACPLICTQETDGSAATYSNECDAETLQYSCVCENGLSPNISEYSQTVPYFICTESNNQCRLNCGISNNACAASCVEDNPCGAQNPTRVNATTTASGTAAATGASSTGDSTAVYSGFGSSASSTDAADSGNSGNSGSSSGASRVMLQFGQIYGLGVVVAGVFTGFAILL